MSFIQSTLQVMEVGKGRVVVRLIPLLAGVLVIGAASNLILYHGLNDAQSMDNAQLARQIVRKQGFTTEFLRPQAVAQLRDYAVSQGLKTGKPRDLFPSDQFPTGIKRILPDTYNAPGYPYLLAAWFYLTHPEFDQVPGSMSSTHIYSPDRWIPPLNQIFMLLTAILVFVLGRRLFDDRVAWISLVAFLGTKMVWLYTLTALSTSVLMFLVTALFVCTLEIYQAAEACLKNEDRSFAPACLWGVALAFLLAASCLFRLDLLVLLIPLLILLSVMPRANFFFAALVALPVVGSVILWFAHVHAVSGSAFGSNFSLLLYGQSNYDGNQVFCTTSIPNYEQVFQQAGDKEWAGFLWHFEHAWSLLGSSPFILFFAASILHKFRRSRTRALHWSLFGSALVLIAANNLGSTNPETVDSGNIVVVLFPAMVVVGGSFFFILIDRLNLQVRLLNTLIVITVLTLTAAPLMLALTTPSGQNGYNFPPYLPPIIRLVGQEAQPDEWITTDMPWATAWYADRASLWLPDSISDFQNLHDNVAPTGLIFLSPVSWSQPLTTFTSGEYKDWYPFIVGLPPPANFPLTVPSRFPFYGSYYSVWSDRVRWRTK